MLKVGIVGTGYMGKIHLSLLTQMNEVELIGLYDINQEVAKAVATDNQLNVFGTFDALLLDSDAIVIASPTSTHFGYASACINEGKHIFIEKPVALNLSEAMKLEALNKNSKSIVQIDMVERFNPAFEEVKPFLTNIRFSTHNRLAPFTPRGADVSVVMDVMIHDLDMILSLANGMSYTVEASGEKLITNNWDVVNATITFENGWEAQCMASRVAERKYRLMHAVTDEKSFKIDLLSKTSFSKNGPLVQAVEENDSSSTGWLEMPVKSTNAIEEGLKSFISSIINNKKVVVSLHDGVQSMEMAKAIEDCINQE